ncbi:hypothetical protein, unlikely [Trypanosoma brucei gambiense DAL972]|uniref:Uncharacterized protein n=1 Tax=Trypanosoma brucei gambiense (strain MHOM/CI/86/DAL972) TaxID=679716 RepID=D0A862_TRYB9|nr:hypothetical protein, unlikely [Trypanosoma brucei gambiense DAL972]CBH17863.1 hypothetical protein, unlikely [Trypanosoma brucei gambiense DAL972]|eukprot:XP_011780127.1 hypothetical protein, unlikely [Trypanosoma brucei gambiense DAL972]
MEHVCTTGVCVCVCVVPYQGRLRPFCMRSTHDCSFPSPSTFLVVFPPRAWWTTSTRTPSFYVTAFSRLVCLYFGLTPTRPPESELVTAAGKRRNQGREKAIASLENEMKILKPNWEKR